MTDKFNSDKSAKDIFESLFGPEVNRKVHYFDLGGVDPFQMDSVMKSIRDSLANPKTDSSNVKTATTSTTAADGKPKEKTSRQESLLKLIGRAQELLKELEASERASLGIKDGTVEMACGRDSRFLNKKEPVNDSCKGDTTTFGWFNEGFTFVTTADADSSYRTRVPVPGSRPEDVVVTVVGDDVVEVVSKIVGNTAPSVKLSAILPRGQVLAEATVENGLLTLRCVKSVKDVGRREFPVTAPRKPILRTLTEDVPPIKLNKL